jgi:hypothetical protein
MITLFCIPKAFTGHTGLIQHNALASWARLPDCEVLVFGNDTGVAAAARAHGLRHIPDVACNEFDTPLVSDLFAQAERISGEPVLTYVNADMILFEDLPRAVALVQGLPRLLLCGRRTNLAVRDPLPFSGNWQALVRSMVGRTGEIAIPGAIDYFAFSRGLFDPIPPFAIGRMEWDQWLLHRARSRGAPIIDATAIVLAVHQNHGDEYLARLPRPAVEREIARNRWLALFHRIDLRDATHALTRDGLLPVRGLAPMRRRLFSLPKYYLPPSSSVRTAYAWWRRRIRGIDLVDPDRSDARRPAVAPAAESRQNIR